MLPPNRLALLRRDNTDDPGSLMHVTKFLIYAPLRPQSCGEQTVTQQCFAKQTLTSWTGADVESSVLLAVDLEGVPSPILDLVIS